jgi:hypothetical protein
MGVGLIAWLGLPLAAAMVAATVVPVLWFLAGRYLGRTPAIMRLSADGDAEQGRAAASPHLISAAVAFSQPLRDRRFVTLTVASTLGLFAQIGLLAHLFSLLVPILGDAGAGVTMGAATACAIGGRSLLGLMMPPHADRRIITAANFILQAVGSVVLLSAGPSVPWVLLGCGLFGLGLGNVTSLPALIAQIEFRPMDLSRVVALVTATSQAGYAFAPAAFGLLRDLGIGPSSSPAPLLFATAAIFQLAAAGTVLLGRRRVSPEAVRV